MLPILLGNWRRIAALFSGNVLASFDFTDWLSLGVDVAFHPLAFDYQFDAALGFSVLGERETFVMGDINATANIGLLTQSDHLVNAGIVGIIVFPTGDDQAFLGDENVQGGGTLVVSRSFGPLLATTNIGFESKNSMQFFNLALDDQLTYGAGLAFDVLPDRLVAMAEMKGLTTLSDPYDTTENSPLEAIGAGRYFWDNGLAATLGMGFGVVDGYGMSDIRIFAGLHYSPLPKAAEETAQAEQPALKDKELLAASDEEGVLAKAPDSPVAVIKRSYLQPNFAFDSSVIRAEDEQKLEAVATLLNENADIQPVAINGHTCSIGSEIYNLGLSERRAISVKKFLIDQGVEDKRLTTEGFGETKPAFTNDTREGRRKKPPC